MTWTVRSVLAFGFALFAGTVAAEGLYHLVGAPICESTPATPVRCSEASGWWVLVLGVAAAVALRALRSLDGVVRRLAFGLLLLGFGLAPLWAAVDDRTDSGTWIAIGSVAAVVGIAVLAGLAAAALRAVRRPDAFATSPAETATGVPARPARPARAADRPAAELGGGQDPFGREPGDGADPFGREE